MSAAVATQIAPRDNAMLGYVHTHPRSPRQSNSHDSSFSDLSDPPSFEQSFSQDDMMDHDDAMLMRGFGPMTLSRAPANGQGQVQGQAHGQGATMNANQSVGTGNGVQTGEGARSKERLQQNMNATLTNVRKSISSFASNVNSKVGNVVKNVKDNPKRIIPSNIRLSRRKVGDSDLTIESATSLDDQSGVIGDGSQSQLTDVIKNDGMQMNQHRPTTAETRNTQHTNQSHHTHTTTASERAERERNSYRSQGLNNFYEKLRARHNQERNGGDGQSVKSGRSATGYSRTASSLMAFYGDLGKGDLNKNEMKDRPATAISYNSKSTAVSAISSNTLDSSSEESASASGTGTGRGTGYQSYNTLSKLSLANSIKNKYPSHSAMKHESNEDDGHKGDEARQSTPTTNDVKLHSLEKIIVEGEREDEDEESMKEVADATPATPHNSPAKSSQPSSLSTASPSKANFEDFVDNILSKALHTSPDPADDMPTSPSTSTPADREDDAATIITTATNKTIDRIRKSSREGSSNFGDIVDRIVSSTNE